MPFFHQLSSLRTHETEEEHARLTTQIFLVSVFFSLIDRRGFLPADESAQTAGADIELPTVATKSEINVVGGPSKLAYGLQESHSPVPALPYSHQNSSSA